MSEVAAEPGLTRLLSDDRLTRRAVSGDERAFAAIFRRYHQSLYRFCLAIVGNPEDAQDALQNTMMKVLRALPGEERKIELKPWLYRIAHNESIDLLRRRRESRELDVEQIAPGYGLAEDAAARERLRSLLADLKELPDRQREVLVMRELGGLDFREIGEALDTSGAVARQTLYEARQGLRKMEEGREMSCATVTKALSDGDGRVTRRRDVRAHLRACQGCRAFRDEIEGRERDLAALAPLPVVAAAGMLQGLIGGSHGAAGGGGLAATLSGGAAKTIGASAAAKGVATAAVVAAIGVTAADKTGVVRLGLPGESATPTKQSPATPAAGTARGEGPSAVSGSGGRGRSEAPQGVKGHNASTAAGSAVGQAGSPGHGDAASGPVSTHPGSTNAGEKGYGPEAEHPSGQGHEKQYPPAAAPGQETAGAHEPSPPNEGNKGGSPTGEEHAATPTKPPQASQPSSPADPPATGKETSEDPPSPPVATPEPEVQPQQNPSVEHRPPEADRGSEKASEKKPYRLQ